MKKYVALALSSVWVWSCMKPELPPEPPMTIVISQCRGWDAAAGPVTVAPPQETRPSAPEARPSDEPEERADLTP